jgi:hypothetical protein
MVVGDRRREMPSAQRAPPGIITEKLILEAEFAQKPAKLDIHRFASQAELPRTLINILHRDYRDICP